MSTNLALLIAATLSAPFDEAEIPTAVQEAAVLATVLVRNPGNNAQGSAVVIHQAGADVYFLTANHLVEEPAGLELHTFSAQSLPKPLSIYRSAQVLAQSKEQDLAILRLLTSDKFQAPVRLATAKDVPKASRFRVLSVGCPSGKPPTCYVDTVTGKKRFRRPDSASVAVWETERATEQGRSGGPLLDRRGQLIGIASGTSEGRGYYVQLEEVYRFLRKNGLEWLSEPPGAR